MKKLLFLFSCLALSMAFSQNFNQEKMNEFMNVLEQHQKFMGSVAITQNGKMVYERAVGFADADNQKKNTTDTRFRIGSITKTFTATLVMKAVEENKLNLSDRLSQFYPEIKNAEKITIEQLLNHRSGIYNITDLPDYLSWNQNAMTNQEMVAKIKSNGIDFEPGTKFSYSNSGYILLGYILEKVYKKSYAEILEQKITKPLGLKNTYYGGKINLQKMEAFSYTLETPLMKSEETDLSIPAAAGAMVSTSADLLKFIQDLFSHKIISEKSLSQMITMTDNYGFGIFSVPFYNTSGFGHNGGIDAFTSALYYFPELKTGYVMLSNGTAFDNNQITIAAMSLATGKNIEIPNFTAANVDPATLQKYAGTYSSTQLPIKIEVREKDGQLFAQATGQGEFPLQAKSQNTFTFDTAGIQLDFDSDKKTMKLLQGGMEILFTKE